MTGPEHYAAAEALLADARRTQAEDDAKRWLARAQVHATLALAAATALNVPHPEGGMENTDSLAWFKAASAGRKR
jgi:hypothetical protein